MPTEDWSGSLDGLRRAFLKNDASAASNVGPYASLSCSASTTSRSSGIGLCSRLQINRLRIQQRLARGITSKLPRKHATPADSTMSAVLRAAHLVDARLDLLRPVDQPGLGKVVHLRRPIFAPSQRPAIQPIRLFRFAGVNGSISRIPRPLPPAVSSTQSSAASLLTCSPLSLIPSPSPLSTGLRG